MPVFTHAFDYIALGILFACLVGTAAVVLSRGRQRWWRSVTQGSIWLHQYQRPRPCHATLAVISIATSMIGMVAFMPPRCATRRKLGIQRYKARAGRQIATLFELAA